MWGRVRELVIYFKLDDNLSRGLRAVGVANHPISLTWPMAYAIVQAVIVD